MMCAVESASYVDGLTQGYRHEAFFYDGTSELMRKLVPFVREGLAGDEPTLVVLEGAKLAMLREALGGDAEQVLFADMAQIGDNPARIIPAWQDFVDAHGGAGARLRGVGEPIGPHHEHDDLVERHRHEALLNVAFADHELTLLCPYDAGALDSDVIEEARRTHPYVCAGGRSRASLTFAGERACERPCEAPLAPPPADALSVTVAPATLPALRGLVAARAGELGLAPARVPDLVVAADELATNSLRHGGGRGRLRIWRENDAIVCEVRDAGRIDDPLAGRRRPTSRPADSRGLWLANQLCDLVQVRATGDGGIVRLHMRLDGRA